MKPASTVPTPATIKAIRHEPSEAISHVMMMAPSAAPSGAPPSSSVAPRPRSFCVIQMALSLPPAG
ncbi:hypothetical protein D9M72_344950 [compost metagenome]